MSPAVAVDVMSGDAACGVRLQACRRLRRERPQTRLLLVGKPNEIRQNLGDDAALFEVCEAADVVQMDEPPARALRRRNTSMRRALDLVAEGRAAAAISAGNTGALMGLGVLVLKVMDGIERPAIAGFMPNNNGQDFCCMLDLGANAECTPAMLRDFALMGSALARSAKNKPSPTVGLLNIGEESFKGGKLQQEAAELLEAHPRINFVGNVEGHDIYKGNKARHNGECVDVVVCDGFTGNVALKVAEGLSGMLAGMLRAAFADGVVAKVCGAFAAPVLLKLKKRLDPRVYNGAALLGLRGLVFKSHGAADSVAFYAALCRACDAAQNDVAATIAADAAAEGAATAPLLAAAGGGGGAQAAADEEGAGAQTAAAPAAVAAAPGCVG